MRTTPLHAQPEAANTNGHTPSQEPSRAAGWGRGGTPETIAWLLPPLTLEQAQTEGTSLWQRLEAIADLIKDKNLPLRAEHLLWTAMSRAALAAREWIHFERFARLQLQARNDRKQDACSKVDAKITAREKAVAQTEQECHEAVLACAVQVARAGLPCDPETLDPASIQTALEATTPTAEELAGEHRVAPATDGNPSEADDQHHSFIGRLAPLALGATLAVTLGTLLGFATITQIRKGVLNYLVILLLVMGPVLLYLLGMAWRATVFFLARAREPRDGVCPRHHGDQWLALGFLIMLSIVTLAEAVIEAFGVRLLHLQMMYASHHLDRTVPVQPFHPLAYGLIGTVISGMYVTAKASLAASEAQRQLRQAWLAYRQWAWQQERWQSQELQDLVAGAYRAKAARDQVRRFRAELETLERRRETLLPQEEFDTETTSRLDTLRNAAVGEMTRVQEQIDTLVEHLESLGARPDPTHRNPWIPMRGR